MMPGTDKLTRVRSLLATLDALEERQKNLEACLDDAQGPQADSVHDSYDYAGEVMDAFILIHPQDQIDIMRRMYQILDNEIVCVKQELDEELPDVK